MNELISSQFKFLVFRSYRFRLLLCKVGIEKYYVGDKIGNGELNNAMFNPPKLNAEIQDNVFYFCTLH